MLHIPDHANNTKRHYAAIEGIVVDVLRLPKQRLDRQAPMYWLLSQVEKMTWAEVYELLEYVVGASETGNVMNIRVAQLRANALLTREHSGYRFVAGQVAPITDPAEIAEIEHADKATTRGGLEGVRKQIQQALTLFGKRPEPDYRNAVKEAISAVEGLVKIINGTRGGGLHAALETVSAKIEMHQALKAGLEKLYGYTSDEDGIRHPILEEVSVDEVDARFMIVTCSAFVNFLIVKADAAGLLKPLTQ